MTGLALQIDGKWAVLSDEASVSIEGNSPVWGEGNSFSLPFELDIEANRHILGNADQIAGQSVYEVLDGKRAVLYTLGIPVYYGKIKMDDEVELSEGTVDVTLVSGNLTFEEMIDGMNCQDVELMDEIEIGTELKSVELYFNPLFEEDKKPENSGVILDGYIHFKVDIADKRFIKHTTLEGHDAINIATPYPHKKYCNVPVAVPKQKTTKRAYIELNASRGGTGICFYVLYFLDCLFNKLGISVLENHLGEMDDMNRLAFFSTVCDYTTQVALNAIPPSHTPTFSISDFGIKQVTGARTAWEKFIDTSTGKWRTGYPWHQQSVSTAVPDVYRMYATSKNFPNTEVSDVLESIKNAFGVSMIYDEYDKTVRLLYYKDILLSPDVRNVSAEVYEAIKLESRTDGFELSYSSGSDDNTSFSYDDYTHVDMDKSYEEIRSNINPYDKTLYLDSKTGNGYRVKIDEEALQDNTKALNPSLFEVGEFVSAKYGDCSNEDRVEKKEVSFTPVISNDISDVENESKLVVFVDVEIGKEGSHTYAVTKYEEYAVDGVATGSDRAFSLYNSVTASVTYDGFDYEGQGEPGSPVNQYDAGFTLGVIRPGEGYSVVDDQPDYDGEGNYKYYVTAANPAFTSDTIDHYGNVYDYNGDLAGGVDPSGRFSLKPRAEKPNPEGGFYPITESYAQRRGLFDKFYSEYAYFVVNRKIVKMKCRMEMADLLNIDWTKRYKIGEYVGFINKYSYSVSSTGISDVELEMYYV